MCVGNGVQILRHLGDVVMGHVAVKHDGNDLISNQNQVAEIKELILSYLPQTEQMATDIQQLNLRLTGLTTLLELQGVRKVSADLSEVFRIIGTNSDRVCGGNESAVFKEQFLQNMTVFLVNQATGTQTFNEAQKLVQRLGSKVIILRGLDSNRGICLSRRSRRCWAAFLINTTGSRHIVNTVILQQHQPHSRCGHHIRGSSSHRKRNSSTIL